MRRELILDEDDIREALADYIGRRTGLQAPDCEDLGFFYGGVELALDDELTARTVVES